jgi:hypothetical protein
MPPKAKPRAKSPARRRADRYSTGKNANGQCKAGYIRAVSGRCVLRTGVTGKKIIETRRMMNYGAVRQPFLLRNGKCPPRTTFNRELGFCVHDDAPPGYFNHRKANNYPYKRT